MKKALSLALALCAFLLFFSGCAEEPAGSPPAPEKVFSREDFQITLTEAFSQLSSPSVFACYDSQDLVIQVLRQDFAQLEETDLSGEISLTDWARAYLEKNRPEAELEEENSLLSYAGKLSEEGQDSAFRTFLFKGSDAFFLVQFSADSARFPSLESAVKSYAESIRVS